MPDAANPDANNGLGREWIGLESLRGHARGNWSVVSSPEHKRELAGVATGDRGDSDFASPVVMLVQAVRQCIGELAMPDQ